MMVNQVMMLAMLLLLLRVLLVGKHGLLLLVMVSADRGRARTCVRRLE